MAKTHLPSIDPTTVKENSLDDVLDTLEVSGTGIWQTINETYQRDTKIREITQGMQIGTVTVLKVSVQIDTGPVSIGLTTTEGVVIDDSPMGATLRRVTHY